MVGTAFGCSATGVASSSDYATDLALGFGTGVRHIVGTGVRQVADTDMQRGVGTGMQQGAGID